MTPKHWRPRDQRGVSTAFILLFAVAILAVAGLVIDGGYALAAKREALNDAEQAARAGADALNQATLRDGRIGVDPGAAMAAAQAYLAAAGAHGTVTVKGGAVTVDVTAEQPTTILDAVGVDDIPVKATATATAINEDTQ